MEVTLFRNGYNIERRKMYLQNPRHNLRSSVDLYWQNSLENHPNDIQRQKEINSRLIKQQYTKVIDQKLQDQLKLNKSSFRVMMAPPTDPKKTIQHRDGYYDSLHRQISYLDEKKKTINSPSKPLINQKSQSLSKSVFGYQIDRNAFQKESYLSKILNDRLQPFLQKSRMNNTSEKEQILKHQSFTINHPISLQY